MSAPSEAGTTAKRRDASNSRVVRVLGGTKGSETGRIRVVGRCRGYSRFKSKICIRHTQRSIDECLQVHQLRSQFHPRLIVPEQS
jgi:hypothetical protein